VRDLASGQGWTVVQTAEGVVLVVDDAGDVLGRINSNVNLGPFAVFDSDGDGTAEVVLAVQGAGILSLVVQVPPVGGTLQEGTRR
jgi:hypothetical protein